jgi:arginine decarboxylase-like protein
MIASVESQAKTEVREKRLSKAQAAEIVEEYREALDAYTYLDFADEA